jgi:glycosyltransferase involved in cell wall biosynthesis
MNYVIAIDYTAALEQRGGIGRYTRELVKALARIDTQTSYRLFAAGQTGATLPDPPGPNLAWKPTRIGSEWLARIWHRARMPLPIECWTGPVDLLHAPDFTLPPTRRGTRTILTVHDLSFIQTPEAAAPGLRAYLNRVVPCSVSRADLVLADSEATRQDVIAFFRTPAEKLDVLYSGVGAHFRPVRDGDTLRAVRERYGIGGAPYILSLGTVQPRKNYDRLVEALHRLDQPDLRLVIAGGKGWLDDPLYEKIAALGFGERVVFPGYVPDEDLPAFYSAARVFAFPSLYEGFGLPPLEAMACGVPVITSNVSSLPEVVGDAALLVDPYDVDALAEALAQALTDDRLRRTLIQRGYLRTKSFTWEKAARQLHKHYARLLDWQEPNLSTNS